MFGLAGDSKNFVFSNGDYLKKTLLVFFPLVFAIAVLGAVGKEMKWSWIEPALMLPYFIVYGCYALSWHRTCLIADGEPHIVTPFRFGKGDSIFLGFFIGMCLALAGSMVGIEWLAVLFAKHQGIKADDPQARWLDLSIVLLDLIPVYLFARFSFILPAQSVGHTLKIREVLAASRGLVWRLIGADFIFIILLGLIMTVYSAVALEVVRVAIADAENMSMTQAISIGLLVTVPIQIMILVTMALMTTALSKAYRWGVENNPAV